jgi:hypothetical protein
MSLNLRDNQIVDVSPLSAMTDLRYTQLQNNKITDLMPLIEMAKKDVAGPKNFAPYWNLYLAGNPLSEEAKSQQIDELKKLGVRVNLE